MTEATRTSFEDQVHTCDTTMTEGLQDLAAWGQPDSSDLSIDQGLYERWHRAIKGYIANGNAQRAARKAGVGRNTFLRVMQRCLQSHGTGGIAGDAGCGAETLHGGNHD